MRVQLACLSRNWLITLNSLILEARECHVGWLTPRPSPGVTIVGFFLPVFVVLLPVVYVPCKGFPGEGPDVSFSMASINVTSCSKNFSAVLALGAEDAKAPIGLCLMQETRIHPLKRGNLSKKFEKHGWTLNIGPQPPVQKIRVANGKSTYRQMHGGLAIASRGNIGVTEEPIPKHFGLGNAVQSAICVYDSFTFRVVNCYLPSGHKHKLARQQLMKSTFEYIASVGPGPTFVGGDFNDAPMNNPSISQVFQAGDFCDVVSEFRATRNLEMGYTFSRTKKPSRARTHQGQTARRCSTSLSTSRIDFFLTNSCASQCVTHAWHAYDKIFPNHVPVCVELTIPVGDMKAFLLKGSPQWSFPPLPKTQQEWDARDSLIQPLISTWLPKILPSAMEGNVHEVWELACGATREILSSLASHAVSSTKGNLPEFVRVSTRKPIRQCSLNHIRRNKVLSLFKELERKFDHFSPRRSLQWKTMLSRTVSNLRGTLDLVGFPQSGYPLTNRVQLDNVCKDFQAFCSTQDAHAQINGIRSWKKRIRISTSKDKKQVHQWLKGGFTGPPKFIRLSDGQVSGSIPTMLEAVSTKMEGIYNIHSGVDPSVLIHNFESKYGLILDQLRIPCPIPLLSNHHFFEACQKKDPSKASGMDGWRYRDLKNLPPSGWVFFRLVATVAEAFGQWPAPVSCVSLATIPKGSSTFLDVDNVRAIGVTSIVYSLWSTIRFSHVSDWMGKLAPVSLLGGIRGRDATETEIQLSLDFSHCVAKEEAVAVFIDRFKCFDILIPQVSLHCARRLGLPEQVTRACLGFYANQTKFFKIAGFYGRKVMSTNSAVQGCSMSILMIKCACSVLTKHINSMTPQVSISTFIDDCKIWGPAVFEDQVVDAFNEICSFDEAIGQKLNSTKPRF